ncbi:MULTISPECIES: universal stress protein [Lactococcus]|mgnify:FL=1|uniref:Universal stress protein n=1 Tax=Lactococcus lactis TaxID=1358 RepID=A0A443LIF1_9LACT|nr:MULTISPECIES: universal stress protein [Lactococcus]MDT3325247.1 universal stress protein [Bacillota bacterium]ADA65141.1 Phage protein, nucleotide-binding protein, Universal stress protein family [Lactococcus lactis subsp. lactis KF147]KST86524.1 Universal stress protein family [Lactococcus lactis subsp. lactis]KST88454.1 Universal stress protein family [Lactococcus lactis subsp. lactis]MCB6852880.1 universal stress protein [Lactococcus lactis]
MKDVYKKILVPVDDSNQAMNALHEAIAVAKRNEAELFILNVKDETRLRGTSIALAMSLDEIEEESKQIIKNLTKDFPKDVAFQTVTFIGNPKKDIVKFAEDNAMDLIVIGANSKKLVDRILIGSTTSYVVEKSPCNVMVVK